jgi:ribosomal protein L32
MCEERERKMMRGMDFESAIFSVIVENIDDHRKRQLCLTGIMDYVRRYGAVGQLPIPVKSTECPNCTGYLQPQKLCLGCGHVVLKD